MAGGAGLGVAWHGGAWRGKAGATEPAPSRDANGRGPVMYIPERSATVTSAVTVPATGLADRARAADSKVGLLLEKRHPGAEPVNGTFISNSRQPPERWRNHPDRVSGAPK